MNKKQFSIAVLILTSLLFTSCKSTNETNVTPVLPKASIVAKDTTDWQGYQIINFTDVNIDGKPINFDLYTSPSSTEKTPLLIAVHGATGKKADWSEIGGYTKGGDFTKTLLDNGYNLIAVDLAYHGTHHLNTEKWNWENGESYDSIFTNHWEDFHAQSLKDIQPVIEFAKKSGKFDTTRTGMVSYSLGGYFINQLAQKHGAIKSLVFLVAGGGSRPGYSAIQNQNGLLEANVYMIAAKNDEYIPFPTSEDFFAGLEMKNKTLITYESGHDLPLDYVKPLVEWLRENL